MLQHRSRRRRQRRYQRSNSKQMVHEDHSRKVRKSRCRKHRFTFMNPDGIWEIIDPSKTFWNVNYLERPHVGNACFEKKFRNRFRLPYHSFKDLFIDTKANPLFKRWTHKRVKTDLVLGLLLLGALRYLGRGWTFDDLEEATSMSQYVHRDFFHLFVKYGQEYLYPKYVKYPSTANEMKIHTKEYEKAGFHGAIGSMDACHIIIEKCSHRLKQNHLGGKSKNTCRSYNLTCNHRRQILHTTAGHPARWNDKTIVLYDQLAVGLRTGSLMNDNIFELFDRNKRGEIIKVKYEGAWLLVDNGYLNWGNTVCPMKTTIFRNEARWSEWLESMRKDVECTFGILKGRFRILKAGIRLHGVNIADRIWMTCCALHNYLLEIDGLSIEWNGDVGLFDIEESDGNVPFAIRRLQTGAEKRNYDRSDIGPGYFQNDDNEEEDANNNTGQVECDEDLYKNINEEIQQNGINKVNRLSSNLMREKLITHFDILFHKQMVHWPRR